MVRVAAVGRPTLGTADADMPGGTRPRGMMRPALLTVGQLGMRRNLFAYIEGYYNRQRIHSALGYLTPEQAERTAN